MNRRQMLRGAMLLGFASGGIVPNPLSAPEPAPAPPSPRECEAPPVVHVHHVLSAPSEAHKAAFEKHLQQSFMRQSTMRMRL